MVKLMRTLERFVLLLAGFLSGSSFGLRHHGEHWYMPLMLTLAVVLIAICAALLGDSFRHRRGIFSIRGGG